MNFITDYFITVVNRVYFWGVSADDIKQMQSRIESSKDILIFGFTFTNSSWELKVLFKFLLNILDVVIFVKTVLDKVVRFSELIMRCVIVKLMNFKFELV